MKSVNFIIVSIDKEYENERGNIISNLDYDDASFITREATVITAPDFTILKEGDKVICHHNIFRMKGSSKGNLVRSDFHIEDDKYFVPLNECFMYKRGDSDWISLSPFCFVKPIELNKIDDAFVYSDLEHINNESHKGYKKLHGILTYPCKELNHLKNSEIIYSEYSEYEFIIDGTLYYKMTLKDILGNIR